MLGCPKLARTLTSREPLPDQIDCPWFSKGSWEVCPEGDIGGSATGATTAEGADLANPVIIHTSEERGVELTCSYEEKKADRLLALDYASANCPTERISICPDSQSPLKAIQSGAYDT